MVLVLGRHITGVLMIIGVPKESTRNEHRVGLTPDAAAHLVRLGHTVVVQRDAGLDARFTNDEYEREGAKIVYSAEEAYKRADLVTRIGPLSLADVDLLNPGSTICGFQHLAVAPKALIQGLISHEITTISYELIEDDAGMRPILTPFSEMAGMLAVHLAAHYLRTDSGGKGMLLGNVTGITPPTVVVLGAGIAGQTAASHALAAGARVTIIDTDMAQLRTVSAQSHRQVATVNASLEPLGRHTRTADVLIGAVLIPGSRSPILVTREMVHGMPSGSVIIDLSIDQGGCVETSRPTTLDQPTFIVDDVVHYCVPNITASVARTASKALARAVLPQLESLANNGVQGAATADHNLAAGLVFYRGAMVHTQVAAAHGLDVQDVQALMRGTDA